MTVAQLAKSIGIQTNDATSSDLTKKHNSKLPSEDTSHTFYQRELPQHLIRLSSPEGKRLFRESMDEGYAEGFFPLTGNFTTQSEPAYCGPSSLAMVLNALEVDPKRKWKGVWRWYSDELLHCCSSVDDVKKNGITFDTFACLARCHASVDVKRANTFTLEEFEKDIEYVTASTDQFLVLSFSRKTLGQTGDGHFSPIGAYNRANRSVLIMDTARYKYPIYWCPLEVVYESMTPIDKETGYPRGYFLLSYDRDHPPLSVCLTNTDDCIQPCSKTSLLVSHDSGLNWTEIADSFCKGISNDAYKEQPESLGQLVSIVVRNIPNEFTAVLARQSMISLGTDNFAETERQMNALLEDTRKTRLYSIVLNAVYPDRQNKSYIPIDLNASYLTLILLDLSDVIHTELPKSVQQMLDHLKQSETVTPTMVEQVKRISEEITNLTKAFCSCKPNCNGSDCCSKGGCSKA
ncbi:Phytochelatin-domain-containing protein [Backusella circina FSU 941]|nr:Phytochelatin-domain-containing protein [Backusella circina FSU 941]